MTSKGWKRTGIGFFGVGVLVASAVLAIAYGLPSKSVSRRDLRIVVNGQNSNEWFRFDWSDGYGTRPNTQDNAWRNSYRGQLVRRAAINEDVVAPIGLNEGDDGDIPTIIWGEPQTKKHKEFFEFDLAKSLVVTRSDGSVIEFTNDYHELESGSSADPKSINSEDFRIAMDGVDDNGNPAGTLGAARLFEFTIKEDLYWADHLGQATDYRIQANDWYYSVYRTGLSKNTDRNAPYNSNSNVFGGFGDLGGVNDPESTDPDDPWYISREVDKMTGQGSTKFSSETGGYPNEYLFTLFGLTMISEMVKDDQGTPQMIGSYKGQETVKISGVDGVNRSMLSGFEKLIVDGLTFTGAPSAFIEDQHSDRETVSGGGVTIDIPDGKAKEFGLLTYGHSFSDILYSSPYTIVESTQFRLTLSQNESYWDKSWLQDEQSVRSYSIDFSQQQDSAIFAQSLLSQYEHDRIYRLPFVDQSDQKQLEIRREAERYGIRYSTPFENGSFWSDMLPVMYAHKSPVSGSHLFNNAFARLWFGADVNQITSGNQGVDNYLDKQAIAFRSQVYASVNWYQMNSVNAPNSSTELWYPYMPPEANVEGSDGASSSKKTIYDYKDELNPSSEDGVNSLLYYTIDSGGDLVSHYIKLSENRDKAQNAESQNEALQSAHFETIQSSFSQLIDDIYANEGWATTTQIDFDILFRYRDVTGTNESVMNAYKNILEQLDSRINVEIVYPNANNFIPLLTNGDGFMRFGGWNADYSGVGSFMTGMSSYQSSLQQLAFAISTTPHLSSTFPELSAYGNFFATELAQSRQLLSPQARSYVQDENFLLGLKNDVLSQVNGSSTALLELVNDYSTESDQSVVNELIAYESELAVFVAKLDLLWQNQTTNDRLIAWSKEIRSIMGVNFGIRRNISNRQIPSPVVKQKWLTTPIPTNRIGNLKDWRVDAERETVFK